MDYLTEKAAQFMNTPSVPILMSYANVTKLLPPKSYINVFDFRSVKALADYLKYLDMNFDEYKKYFEWKYIWKVDIHLKTLLRPKCELCDILYTNYNRTYTNLADWFAGPNVCSLDGLQKHFTDFENR